VEAVGMDINLKGKRTEYPIIASVEKVPIRSDCAHYVRCTDVLEHCDHPWHTLSEIKRTMKRDGRGFLMFPVDANWPRQLLKRFIKEFPFSIPSTLTMLWRLRKYKGVKGMPHVSQVRLSDTEYLFRVTSSSTARKLHWYFVRGPFRFMKRRLEVGEFANLKVEVGQMDN